MSEQNQYDSSAPTTGFARLKQLVWPDMPEVYARQQHFGEQEGIVSKLIPVSGMVRFIDDADAVIERTQNAVGSVDQVSLHTGRPREGETAITGASYVVADSDGYKAVATPVRAEDGKVYVRVDFEAEDGADVDIDSLARRLTYAMTERNHHEPLQSAVDPRSSEQHGPVTMTPWTQ